MDCLNVLADTNCFGILQDKMNQWRFDFESNCAESNISKCCELLELNARIQAQLFKLLGLCALYGGLNGSEGKIKKRLQPFLGDEYLSNGLTSAVVMDILGDIGRRTKKHRSKHGDYNKYENNEQNISPKERTRTPDGRSFDGSSAHGDMTSCNKNPGESIQNRLNDLENMIVQLSTENKKSATNPKKKKKRMSMHRSNSLPDNASSTIGNDIGNTDAAVQSEPTGDFSGSDVEEIRNDKYLQGVVGRYNDLFSETRINAMNILRQYTDDHENNQRILFALVMTAAKCVADLQRTLRNPYGARNNTSLNIQFRQPISRSSLKNLRAQIIYEIIHNRGQYYHFHLPHGFSFLEMEEFINRTIHLFWSFGGTVNGLALMEAADGELFDEHKYRRSYDSEFTAPLVNHHIWPCLMQGKRVLVKGEACTKASTKMAMNRLICSTNNPSPHYHSGKQ